MSSEYVLTPEAESDLADVWLYIARDSPAAADRVEQELYDAFAFVAEHAQVGRVRPDVTSLPVRFCSVPRSKLPRRL